MATQTLAVSERAMTALDIRAHVNLIQEVMQAVMKQDTHYGIIPGCKKPSLWKPGAEVLFTTFHISVDQLVDDLSTPDEARFRVTAKATSFNGVPLGSAVGEASSDEEKYKWREIVCQEEYDATPENRRRDKWKNGRQKPFMVQQVRTNIADCRNTVLKMAAKRASVALALQVTAASDIFTQDIQDIPEEMQAAVINGDAAPTAPLPTEIKRKESTTSTPVTTQPVSTTPTTGAQAAKPPVSVPRSEPARQAPVVQQRPQQEPVISEARARRFFAIWKAAGKTPAQVDNYLREEHGITSDRNLTIARYNEACAWAESGDGF